MRLCSFLGLLPPKLFFFYFINTLLILFLYNLLHTWSQFPYFLLQRYIFYGHKSALGDLKVDLRMDPEISEDIQLTNEFSFMLKKSNFLFCSDPPTF